MKQLASQVKDIVIVGECAKAMDAYNLLQEQSADLILLDIEMPGSELVDTQSLRTV